ncbi:TetR/AcrR family transcriptional regulator [Roseivivax sp. GX 12232]|uniref:TetR/AcrR family transcriptional regulator n=1 Tax=Roseivivax sp. GX 12232 TaxID=2900547 RepID=UPI001E4D2893|nr:TetR/AcrR family transcriptional regulator [Roseivivax sp. GX 12232]MCE0506515.1 TetR/AcrR family transcriptional regulator [Roseivivax sp. GX 12232]
MDPRRHRTRLRLQAALRALLAEKPLSTISVEALARRAGTTRQSFYSHYGDLASMLGDYLDGLLAEIERRNLEMFGEGGDCPSYDDHLRKFTRLFGDLDRDDPRLHALFDGVPGLAPEDRFAELIETLMGRLPAGPGVPDPQLRRIAARFYTGAFVAVLRDWLRAREPIPPHELAAAFTSLAFGGWPDAPQSGT